MEPNKDFQELSDKLNEEVNKQLKEKRYMERILINISKSSISKTNTMEKINLGFSFFATLYFITRTLLYADKPLLLWTGALSIFVWLFQFVYSWIGYRKLEMLKPGEDSIKDSITKIVSLLNHYTLQKKIYLWGAPITLLTTFPIPAFEFTRIDLLLVINRGNIFYFSLLMIGCILLTIWISKKFWEDHFNAPLENAKQNLEELLS